ncbi:MAG: hypothetical protein HGB36_04825 [Chlorobiaceae bacterium]|nr:hypothetical protein [Chlorobiaceae bacterium]
MFLKKVSASLFFTICLLFISACKDNEPLSLKDADGRSYSTVKLGSHIWTAENLDVSHYRNGDPVPEVKDPDAWSKLTTGAWCWYGNSSENGKIYGKLYNWYAVSDPRGLAPEGWHVAADAEWSSLSETLGGDGVSGGRIKTCCLWKEKDGSAGKSGFDLPPGGARRDTDGAFVLQGEYSRLWSSTESNSEKAWGRAVGYFDQVMRRGEASKRLGFAVRCVKD